MNKSFKILGIFIIIYLIIALVLYTTDMPVIVDGGIIKTFATIIALPIIKLIISGIHF